MRTRAQRAADHSAPAAASPSVAYQFRFAPAKLGSVRLHFLSGITLLPWLRLLLRYRRELHWQRFAHRVAFLSLLACVNSLSAAVELLVHGRRIARQELHPAPLFILGHPRSGTTHLHNLLSCDGRWAFCDTWTAGFISACLTLRPLRVLLAGLLDPTRPMDAMALSWALPAEDEIATTQLSGGVSPYLALVVPCCEAAMLRSLYTFDAANSAELAAWKAAFLRVCRIATLAAGPAPGGGPRPLLLKSPVHTARIALMRRVFPGARFLYVHRHPLEVLSSALHMAESYYPFTFLQLPTDAELTEFVLAQGELLYSEYARQKIALPPGALCEVAFQDLDADPASVLRSVYAQLGLGDYQRSGAAGAVAAYLSQLVGFRKNALGPLPAHVEAAARLRWAAAFREHGYQ